MFKDSIQLVKHSIFPLFYYGQNGPQSSFGVLGTGFFIDDEGHFLTAEHVIKAKAPGQHFGYAGNVPLVKVAGAGFTAVKILALDASKDLALGKIEIGALPPLKFATTDAVIGESIGLCGYPMPMIKPSSILEKAGAQAKMKLNLDVTSVRQYWQPTIKMDSIRKGLLYNKTFKSFITQHSALPGMSGGPVFNLAGEIVGLTSANWTRKVQRNSQLHTNVENGIAVDLKEINEFLSQHLYKERIALA